MGGFCEAALALFGIKATKIFRERGAYICESPAGLLRLAKVKPDMSPEAIIFAHTVKEHLAARGYERTDRFFITAANLPYAYIGADCFVLTRCAGGREVDFSCPDESIRAIRSLAEFHKAAQNFSTAAPAVLPHDEIFRRGAQLLASVCKQIRKQSKRSDFELLLLKHAPAFEARISHALDLLTASAYHEIHTAATTHTHLCHNALKDEFFTLAQDSVYLSHFYNAALSAQITDVAAFIRLAHTAQPAHFSRLIEAYDKITPLPRGAEPVLQALLEYPAAFVKIISQYSTKKRAWTPAALVKRLEEII